MGKEIQLLNINPDKCKKDGICATECPMAIIQMDHGEGYPRLLPGTETVCLRYAPALVVAHAPKEALNGTVDLTLALSYLELAAPTLGLGTCWAGLLQGALLSRPEMKEMLGIPENHPHHYPMMLGYAKPRYYRLPERKPPKIMWG